MDIVDHALYWYHSRMGHKCDYFVMLILYSSLLQAQGFLDAIVYGLTNRFTLITHFPHSIREFRNRFNGKFLNGLLAFAFSPVLVIPMFFYFIYRLRRKPEKSILAPPPKKKSTNIRVYVEDSSNLQ